MSGYNLVTTNGITQKEQSDVHLRSVDLNLLTVFDAVMQMQNVTRAAQSLGMSQPAVSNAVARLKIMFDDELFFRYGRGIQPTSRARELFGPVRQALQLVHNELPGASFEPKNSDRLFNLLMLRSSKILQFTQSLLSCFNEQFGTQCKMIELVLYFQTFEFEYRINRHEYVVALGSNPTGWGFG